MNRHKQSLLASAAAAAVVAARPVALAAKHFESMRQVAEGADVIGYGVASDLRDVQRLHPGYIVITARKHKYSVTERLPYFGAILTDAGKAALKAHDDAAAALTPSQVAAVDETAGLLPVKG